MSTALETAAEDSSEPGIAGLETPVVAPRAGFRTDTVAQSVMVLLIMAALQRIIGFVRGVLVCRWLAPDELGHWDMAFGFLTLAAPLTVLGLPGSFGRYVEYFRQRGQLRTLVRRTATACAILTAISVCAISLLRTQFSALVFGQTEDTQLVLVMALALVAVIAYNFLTELLNALRLARVNAIVQFFNSLAFAGFTILLLVAWRQEAASLVTAYGLSCLMLIVGMLWFLRPAVAGTSAGYNSVAARDKRRILVAIAAVCRVGVGHQFAVQPVRRGRSLHDRPHSACCRSAGRGRQLPQFAHRAAAVGFDFHAFGHDALATSEPRLGRRAAWRGFGPHESCFEAAGAVAVCRFDCDFGCPAVVVRHCLQGKIRRRHGRAALDANLLHVVRHDHHGAECTCGAQSAHGWAAWHC